MTNYYFRSADIGILIILLQDASDIFMYSTRIAYRLQSQPKLKAACEIIEPISFYCGFISWFILRVYFTVTFGIYGLAKYGANRHAKYAYWTVILMIPIWFISIYVAIVSRHPDT